MNLKGDSTGWTVIVGGVALAIYGTFGRPSAITMMGLLLTFLWLVGFLYFDHRLDRIETKLEVKNKVP